MYASIRFYIVRWQRLIPLTFAHVFTTSVRCLFVHGCVCVSKLSVGLYFLNSFTRTHSIWSGQAHGKICKKHLHPRRIRWQSGRNLREQRWTKRISANKAATNVLMSKSKIAKRKMCQMIRQAERRHRQHQQQQKHQWHHFNASIVLDDDPSRCK